VEIDRFQGGERPGRRARVDEVWNMTAPEAANFPRTASAARDSGTSPRPGWAEVVACPYTAVPRPGEPAHSIGP